MLKLSGFEKFDNKVKGKGGVKSRSGVKNQDGLTVHAFSMSGDKL